MWGSNIEQTWVVRPAWGAGYNLGFPADGGGSPAGGRPRRCGNCRFLVPPDRCLRSGVPCLRNSGRRGGGGTARRGLDVVLGRRATGQVGRSRFLPGLGGRRNGVDPDLGSRASAQVFCCTAGTTLTVRFDRPMRSGRSPTPRCRPVRWPATGSRPDWGRIVLQGATFSDAWEEIGRRATSTGPAYFAALGCAGSAIPDRCRPRSRRWSSDEYPAPVFGASAAGNGSGTEHSRACGPRGVRQEPPGHFGPVDRRGVGAAFDRVESRRTGLRRRCLPDSRIQLAVGEAARFGYARRPCLAFGLRGGRRTDRHRMRQGRRPRCRRSESGCVDTSARRPRGSGRDCRGARHGGSARSTVRLRSEWTGLRSAVQRRVGGLWPGPWRGFRERPET